jgi:hypothetical protein
MRMRPVETTPSRKGNYLVPVLATANGCPDIRSRRVPETDDARDMVAEKQSEGMLRTAKRPKPLLRDNDIPSVG